MELVISELPSGGFNCSIESIELNPLNYKQLIKYDSKKYTEPIDKLLWDIECLIGDIPRYQELSAFDIQALIFMRKYISASFEDEVKLTIGDLEYTLNISDVTFKDLNPAIKDIEGIKFSSKTVLFKIPTIDEYKKVLKLAQLGKLQIGMTPERLMIATCLGADKDYKGTLELINTATKADIAMLDYLDRLVNDTVNDVTVRSASGGDKVIKIDDLITDMFQFITYNNKPKDSAIITRKSV